MVLNLATFSASFALFLGPLGLFFCSLGAIVGVGVRFKNIFGTYLCSQSSLVLEVQPYIFAFTSAKFGAFFAVLGLWGLFWGLRSGSKTFLEPTYVVNQLWFLKYNHIFFLLLWPFLGPFLPFLGLWGLFLGLRSGSKTFLGPTYID